MAFGGAGGSTIISGVAQIAMRTLYMGWNIKELSSAIHDDEKKMSVPENNYISENTHLKSINKTTVIIFYIKRDYTN